MRLRGTLGCLILGCTRLLAQHLLQQKALHHRHAPGAAQASSLLAVAAQCAGHADMACTTPLLHARVFTHLHHSIGQTCWLASCSGR
jgi:hypothetical protein